MIVADLLAWHRVWCWRPCWARIGFIGAISSIFIEAKWDLCFNLIKKKWVWREIPNYYTDDADHIWLVKNSYTNTWCQSLLLFIAVQILLSVQNKRDNVALIMKWLYFYVVYEGFFFFFPNPRIRTLKRCKEQAETWSRKQKQLPPTPDSISISRRKRSKPRPTLISTHLSCQILVWTVNNS